MAFTHLLGRDPAWKRALLDEVTRRTGKEVLAYVQVDAIGAGVLPPARLEAELEVVLADGRDVVVFTYEQLAADPARAALLARYVRASRAGAE
jgi:hypothetical protein